VILRLILLGYFIIGLLTIIFYDGTGGGGDSVYHFLYAKEAPQHPELFFNHWAKPLFVLIASPFAQFGLIGVKLLNLFFVSATIWFTAKTANHFNIRENWISGLMLIFSPLYFALTFSGLTEPMFAFFLILATFLFLKKHFVGSLIIISFLPFIRSEGLFFIATFGFTFIWIKKWKMLPLLLTGSILYGIAGYPFHGDFLWVFNKVPYARLSSTYGEGNPFHFVNQLIYVVGIPIYILFWLGIVAWFWQTWKRGFKPQLTFIIYGGVFSFILAHSIFWHYGIFNSMGLNRVLISIMPYIAIIALIGLNFFSDVLLAPLNKKLKLVRYFFLGYALIFPFTSNPAALDFAKDLGPTPAEQVASEMAKQLEKDVDDFRIVVADINFCYLMNKDCFDSKEKVFLNEEALGNLRANDIIIWDNWFAVVEQGISLNQLENHSQLEKINEIKRTSPGDRTVHFVAFKVRREILER
jgi:hypothetical protein